MGTVQLPCGRRALNKARTREAIADAALALAASRDVDEITVEEIAQSAGVSARTFFNYFPNKLDAFLDFDPEGHATMAQALRARPAHEAPLDALLGAILAEFDPGLAERMMRRMDLVERHAGLHRRFLGYFAELERQLVEVVAERLGLDPDADPYPALVVANAAATFRLTVRRAAGVHDLDRLEQRLRVAFATLSAGLAPPADRSGPSVPSSQPTPAR